MSLIICLGDCKYQKDGYCSLDKVTAWTGPAAGTDCIYFVPSSGAKDPADSGQDSLDGLPDRPH